MRNNLFPNRLETQAANVFFGLNREQPRGQKTQTATNGFDQSQLRQGVYQLDRIVEELGPISDARKTGPFQQIVAQNFAPHVFDQRKLGIKSVTSDIEQIALVMIGSGETTHHVIPLQNHRPDASLQQLVSATETGGSSSEYDCAGIRISRQRSYG